MTVYAVALLAIDNRDRYNRYASRFAASLDGYDAQLLAADEHPTVIEGDFHDDKVVLIAFRDRAEFDRWSTSDTYRSIAVDRVAATRATILLLAGTRDRGARTL